MRAISAPPSFSPFLTLTRNNSSLRFQSRLSLQSYSPVNFGFCTMRAQCSINRGPNPGESDSKAVLDAFFLGKAFAEALSERIGSSVGEFLSVVGQLQAEQQKQLKDFEEEVLERARKAKEKAAREAKEERVVPRNSTISSDSNPEVVPLPSTSESDTSEI